MSKISRLLLLMLFLFASGCPDEPTASSTPTLVQNNPPKAEAGVDHRIEEVKAHLLKLQEKLYVDQDIDFILESTHPVVYKLAKKEELTVAVKDAMKMIRESGMKATTYEFPDAPIFVESKQNEFVIVPTFTIFEMDGVKVESRNLQFGARAVGSNEPFKYLDGTQIKSENVNQFFPDFPAGVEWPKIYKKKI